MNQQQGSGSRNQVQPQQMQLNPRFLQVLMQSDFGEDLMDNEVIRSWIMAKQMQPAPATGMRGHANLDDAGKALLVAEWMKSQQNHEANEQSQGQRGKRGAQQPMYYPGMDEDLMQMQMMQQWAQSQHQM